MDVNINIGTAVSTGNTFTWGENSVDREIECFGGICTTADAMATGLHEKMVKLAKHCL